MATTTTKTNKPILPRGVDNRPVDSYNRAELYSGKALDFDGVNDYVAAGTLDVTGYTAISVAMYLSKDSQATQIPFSLLHSGSDDIRILTDSSIVEIALDDGTVYDLSAELPLETWGFIVLTFDGSTLKGYLNGVEFGSESASFDFSTADGTIQIGKRVGFGLNFDGEISNAKVFNTALTATQVADLYNNPEKVVPTGVANTALKLWLPMQEGAGTTAYDGSSTENGPNLIVNGDFATDSDWTKGAGWSIGGGVATHDSSLGAGDLYQDFSLTIGKSYKITIEITATDTTELYFMTDSGDYVEVTGSPIGVHSHIFVADDSLHRVGVRGSANWDGSVDNITLEELNFANHGTINGATWTHGIGAPVAQTAVIDWNKGVNYLAYSEDFDQWTELVPGTGSVSVTSNFAEAPDGSNNATRLQASAGSDYGLISQTASSSTTGNYISAVWAKSNTGSTQSVAIYGRGDSSNVVNVTTDWTRITKQSTGSTNYLNIGSTSASDASVDILIWGASVNHGTEVDSYIPTLATAQTTPVLLPQGLTTGRDITGVNLFENVRKQGALNLDGKSWAEVHDNTSLDFGTGSFTLEAWARWRYVNQGSIFNLIISLGGNITSANNAGLMVLNNLSPHLLYSNIGTTGSPQNEGDWIHIIGTYDEANATIYINGAQADQDERIAVDMTNGFTKFIGRDGTDPNRYYHDQIAQPRIYNRALTASEVLNNYNATKTLYI